MDPTLALAYAEQSYVYFMIGQSEQATKAIKTAQKWLPKASPMEQFAICALAYSWDAESNSYRDYEYEWLVYGEEFLPYPFEEEIINIAPGGVWDEPLIHKLLAFAYMREGKCAEANQHNQQWFKAIQQRLLANPEDASLLYKTATYCLGIGQYVDEAIDMELKAIKLDPEEGFEGKRYVLSRLYELRGDIELSLKWVMESVKYLPDPRPIIKEGGIRVREVVTSRPST